MFTLREQLTVLPNRQSATLKEAFPIIDIEALYAADIARRTARAPPPRARQQPSRALALAPLAAAAAVASAREDAIATSQRAYQHMVRIIGENRLNYRVQWSQPEAKPAETWERKTVLEHRYEYMEMVWRWNDPARREEMPGVDTDSDEPPI